MRISSRGQQTNTYELSYLMRNSKYDFSSELKKKKKTVGLTHIHILSTSTRSYQIFGCFTQSGKKSYSIY